jgi:pimeloyl-ACP methyl ester carboxylesterase
VAAGRGGVASAVLVHGAGNGPWVFDGWRDALGDADVYAVDLQAGLVVGEASMQNYAAEVACAAGLLEPPLGLVGWSMGGLVAMLAARRVEPAALVLLEPSTPAEVQGCDKSVVPEAGTFDPEAAYGPFPPGIPKRPESSLARAERKRGVSVPELPARTLVVYGREFPEERGRAIAERYGVDAREVAGADHWRLVLGGESRAVAREFLLA